MARGHAGTNKPGGDGARAGRRRCMGPSGVGVAQCEAGGWCGRGGGAWGSRVRGGGG